MPARGAQPGNNNALKHGFYSRKFKTQEAADLDALTSTGLQDEIAMIRVAIRRLFETASTDTPTLLDLANVVDVLTRAGDRQGSILRVDQVLNGPQSSQICRRGLAETRRYIPPRTLKIFLNL
jgi:hypothetical protein